ncbi:MAG: tRNA (guanosine(37)-N1)-methyltransferase TrmD [Gammaproteobacteria bacterium]
MRIDVVSLFPALVESVLSCGVTGRAVERGLLSVAVWNPRHYTEDKHRSVDDRPYGGGPGMVMRVEPLRKAVQAARRESEAARALYLSPQGKRLDQQAVNHLAREPHLILVAGRYEGVDERLIALEIDEEWSIGDYVLSGGELAAMVMIDALARVQPGALGDDESAAQDSFMRGLLDHPHYTRPEQIGGLSVPEVLQGGNHGAVHRWRLKQALGRTWLRRPDLLDEEQMDAKERELLAEFVSEQQGLNRSKS